MIRLRQALISAIFMLPIVPAMALDDAGLDADEPVETAAEDETTAPALDRARGLAIIRSLDRLRRDNIDTWQSLDRNGDGGLCAEELQPIAGKQAESLITLFDSNNNGRLDPYEIAFYASEATHSAAANTALSDHDRHKQQAQNIPIASARGYPESGPGSAHPHSLPGSYRTPVETVGSYGTTRSYGYSATRMHIGYPAPLIIYHVMAPISVSRHTAVRRHHAILGTRLGWFGQGSAHAGTSSLFVTPRQH